MNEFIRSKQHGALKTSGSGSGSRTLATLSMIATGVSRIPACSLPATCLVAEQQQAHAQAHAVNVVGPNAQIYLNGKPWVFTNQGAPTFSAQIVQNSSEAAAQQPPAHQAVVPAGGPVQLVNGAVVTSSGPVVVSTTGKGEQIVTGKEQSVRSSEAGGHVVTTHSFEIRSSTDQPQTQQPTPPSEQSSTTTQQTASAEPLGTPLLLLHGGGLPVVQQLHNVHQAGQDVQQNHFAQNVQDVQQLQQVGQQVGQLVAVPSAPEETANQQKIVAAGGLPVQHMVHKNGNTEVLQQANGTAGNMMQKVVVQIKNCRRKHKKSKKAKAAAKSKGTTVDSANDDARLRMLEEDHMRMMLMREHMQQQPSYPSTDGLITTSGPTTNSEQPSATYSSYSSDPSSSTPEVVVESVTKEKKAKKGRKRSASTSSVSSFSKVKW